MDVPPPNLITYINGFRLGLDEPGEMAKQKLKLSQNKMKKLFDHKIELREFSPGDKVLVLLPLADSRFQAKFFDPCNVICCVLEQNHLNEKPNKIIYLPYEFT